MTQKVKSSPSLKGILKEELRDEMQSTMLGFARELDSSTRRMGDMETNQMERFHSIFGRLSDLEKDSFTKKEGSFFEDNYYLILIVAIVIYIAALIYIRQSE